MNKIILTGRLTKDGEVRTTSNQKEVYTNTIAVKRNHKNSNGEYESDFFNIVLWQPIDYIKNNAKKGVRTLVEGKIQQRSYEADGTTKYITEIIADNMEIYIDKVENTTPKEEAQSSKSIIDKEMEITDDMLPF